MNEVSTIGLDLAKYVFQAHGADAAGKVVFRKQLRRNKLLAFFAEQPACLVAIEACSGAHYWAREIGKLGHEVRLIPPAYVKPFVKRQKNDMADAEAICEAAQRPTMRFVPVKSEEQQASAVVFRTRDLLIRQRTQAINALRGHLAEYGVIVAKGTAYVAELVERAMDPKTGVPEAARFVLEILIKTMVTLEMQIKKLDSEITRRARKEKDARRLMTIPGVGPMTATALLALAPAAGSFRCGRDFAAWLGLTPLQRSTGGKQKLGATSKMGERTLRRLLIIGATAVVQQARRRGASPSSWLGRMIARKPPMLVATALANKMARVVWALMANGGVYKAPAVAA
ncbi:IS110 family transposase [Bradyrhizobium sp. CB1650]|uniref:IS110 family transposase n=1 Tax=Bradyrhizobium sp. CB1650 TaxID=3039153 RepID=UPI0024355802|nr:IS110 family transposase [Bradyrhizobium sp. CB1650]WGD50850.1 IS110 family transposase [Bradyrhizobium sp. CB1650]